MEGGGPMVAAGRESELLCGELADIHFRSAACQVEQHRANLGPHDIDRVEQAPRDGGRVSPVADGHRQVRQAPFEHPLGESSRPPPVAAQEAHGVVGEDAVGAPAVGDDLGVGW